MSSEAKVGKMETGIDGSGENGGKWRKKLQVTAGKIKSFPILVWKPIYKVGRDDPRRVVHALKVGLALTLASLLYLLEPLFEGIGQNAIWAVMTVVVVVEFTAGATLCKGLNRGIGTVLAGALAFLIEYIAGKTSSVTRAVFIGSAVFVIGASTTYLRFIPHVKKNYDYGFLIFLLTFNLITVSSYRVSNVLNIAQERLYTIAIGCGICLVISLLIFPIWSGEDLHNSTVHKLEVLAKSIEVCVVEYFSNDDKVETLHILEGHRAIIDSKAQDETLALHASWEPRHGIPCKSPWQQYVKLGTVLRHFGYTTVALHGCLRTEIQTPKSCRALFEDPCFRLAKEVSKVLMELANSIKMRRQCAPGILSDHLHVALQDLNNALNSQPTLFVGSNVNQTNNILPLSDSQSNKKGQNDRKERTLLSSKTDNSVLLEWKTKKDQVERKTLRHQTSKIAITSIKFSEALPFAAFASLLLEAVARLDNVIEEVEELGRVACFKEFKPGDDEFLVTSATPRVGVTGANFALGGVE